LIYDAENKDWLPGRLIRKEGDAETGDAAADEAYKSTGATYDFYNDIFNRNSIDNNGMQIISTVHYLQSYDNAFWDGEQMVFGDGDDDLPEEERLFNRFTKSVDIIAHELTHGVMQYEANLVYFGQPGALNEAFSDIFGIMVKQRLKNQTAEESNWLIGEEIFTPNISGIAIRSMKEPGTAYSDPLVGYDPQPAHMDNYVETFKDNGGVHINNSIPNKAFCISAIEMGGYAWEKAGKIWYTAMCDRLPSDANFQEAANVTYAIAKEIYGKNSQEHLAIAKGWESVGIAVESKE
jgi:Zn-dependent metalloprotease